MQLVAKKMGLGQIVVGTATVFYRRLYFRRTFRDYDPELYSIACLYLSSKLEEAAFHQGQAEIMIHTIKTIVPSFPFVLDHLMKAEYLLLEELQFDLIVYSPYRPLAEYAADAKLSNHLGRIWAIISDSMKLTDLCLSFAPYLITLAAMFLFSITEGIDILSWFASLNTDMRVIGDIATRMTAAQERYTRIEKAQVTAALTKLQSALSSLPGSQQLARHN